jgi:5'-3' exonuclease
MTAPDGHPHNAIRGVLQTIERLRGIYQPRTLLCAWDADWRPEWRVNLIPSYKTHRVEEESPTGDEEAEPDELGPQIGALREILDAWGVPVVGVREFEADDVAGTLAQAASEAGRSTVVVTGDRDFVQLVGGEVRVLMTVKGGLDSWPLLDADAVVERFGVSPSQYLDVAILRGDPSDGLPGVPGIGEKTAVALISAFGTLENVRQASASESVDRPLTPRLARLVVENGDYLDAAERVAAIRRDVRIPHLQDIMRQPIPAEATHPQTWEDLLAEWGVQRFAQGAVG